MKGKDNLKFSGTTHVQTFSEFVAERKKRKIHHTIKIVFTVLLFLLLITLGTAITIEDSLESSSSSHKDIVGMWYTTSHSDTIYYTFEPDGTGYREQFNADGKQYQIQRVTWSGENGFYTIKDMLTFSVSTFTINGDTAHSSAGFDFVKTAQKEIPALEPTVISSAKQTQYSASSPVQNQDEVITRNYNWTYNGYVFTLTVPYSKSVYNYYKRLGHGNPMLERYVSESVNRKIVSEIASLIAYETGRLGFDEFDRVMCAASFVQSLPYISDKETTGFDEYVRYPVETLVDMCGDCDDTAVLTAAILSEMGYDCALLEFKKHVAVGVKGGDGIQGTYFLKNGDKYFYLETTNTGWEIGECLDDYTSSKVNVVLIK